ncbi:MAG TPA: AAA family ATPase [Telmatospirillum sp.]|nr:AAA family ATPase [Telmatospirillum sp.]
MQNKFGKLQTLTVKGYKSIYEIESLDLREINIVIGQNGAGKSNFVSLFRLLPRLAREELQDYVIKQGGLNKILYFGSKITDKIELYFQSDVNEYKATLEPTSEGTLTFTEEWCAYMGTKKWINVPNQIETQLRRTKRGGRIPPFICDAIENWRVYHFHDTSEHAPLRSSASLTEPERLAANGGNLPAFLYFLQEQHPDAFGLLLDTVRQVAPFIGAFVLRPEALNKELIRLRWRHVGREELFDVSDLSDGTLRFIALSALLLQPEPPSTIVLDEPELGLHPAAIAQLAALMHQVAPAVQIIAATQSPAFANHFGWEDFVVVDRDEDASRFRRLTEDEVRPWMDEFAMGEIWEKNLIGGRP